ncbi:PA14 domain-containing protein [Bifidobacterium choloepi]|uniref:Fibro-slime domain-containing protein n=1 Tax=Bifidobacterium choloepi TaxID=2614131 RepID=A0A6I5N295_9BIFI|nr:hypothetical protein [Bifidobacterium choloepi]NEG70616.1 hypothetical protein [Bifidobacterium choloepi]
MGELTATTLSVLAIIALVLATAVTPAVADETAAPSDGSSAVVSEDDSSATEESSNLNDPSDSAVADQDVAEDAGDGSTAVSGGGEADSDDLETTDAAATPDADEATGDADADAHDEDESDDEGIEALADEESSVNTYVRTYSAETLADYDDVIIAGSAGKNVMTDITKTGSAQGFDTDQPGTMDASSAYWQFEKTGDGDNVYYLKTRSGEEYFNGNAKNLTLVTNKAQATKVTVTINDDNTFYLQYGSYYINTYSGDVDSMSLWAGWNETGGGSKLRLYVEPTINTSTVNPASVVINLFDYWTGENRSDPDGTTNSNWYGINRGINYQHALKFHSGNDTLTDSGWSYGDYNKWTESGNGPRYGILANSITAGESYPRLSGGDIGNFGVFPDSDKLDTQESLDYLFNPATDAAGNSLATTPESEQQDGKLVFTDVQGLLSINDEGYFEYNSKDGFASFDEETNSFTVYNEPASCKSSVTGEFFPFNTIGEVDDRQGCYADVLNHYFGLNIVTRFIQKDGGYADINSKQETTFEFTGDDDVWIYIDDVLVADLGGIHDPVGVKINFVDGSVSITRNNGTVVDKTTTIRAQFAAAGLEKEREWSTTAPDTFADNTTHTLKFYYLERGNSDSNMWFKSNLTEIPTTSLMKIDQYGEALAGAVFATYQTNGEWDSTTNSYQYLLADGSGYAGWPTEDVTVITDLTASDAGYVYRGKDLLFKPTYTGVTDYSGQMIFDDPYGSPYSVAELKTMLGEQFILREILVPEGYHAVSNEALLRFDGDLLQSVSPYSTGVWASPNALVTATNTLYLVDQTTGATGGTVNYYSPGDMTTNGTLFAVVLKRNGADFSLDKMADWDRIYGNDEVGYSKTEDRGLAGAIEAARQQEANGYGNSVFTYSASGMQVFVEGLPGYASQYYAYVEQTYFEGSAAKVQAVLDDPESDPKGYALLEDIQYFIAFYYTSEDSLATADENNTHRVRSHKGIVDGYDGFSMQWSATIEVPNVENRLIFRDETYYEEPVKTDGQDDSATYDGSGFALYSVDEVLNEDTDENGYDISQIYYIADDETTIVLEDPVEPNPTVAKGVAWVIAPEDDPENNVKSGDRISAYGSYEINQLTDRDAYPNAGQIAVTIGGENYTISPAKNAKGDSQVKPTLDENNPDNYVGEDGTNYFRRLLQGRYVLRQTTAPVVCTADASATGGEKCVQYEINPEATLVEVHSTAIYANAGGDRNGVIVGNGAGYVVKSLDVFASMGIIDESLSWIASLLRVNYSKTFAGFEDDIKSGELGHYGMYSFEVDDGQRGEPGISNAQTDDVTKAMITYLEYDPASGDSIFDYKPNDDQDARVSDDGTVILSQAGEKMMRLYTDEGWGSLVLYQDYIYGYAQSSRDGSTNYTKLVTIADEAAAVADETGSDSSGSAASSITPLDLTSLFSNSTFVVYYNTPVPYYELPSTGGAGVAGWLVWFVTAFGLLLVGSSLTLMRRI